MDANKNVARQSLNVLPTGDFFQEPERFEPFFWLIDIFEFPICNTKAKNF